MIIQPPPTLVHFIHLLPTIRHARELNITIVFVFKKVSHLLKKWDNFFCLVLTKYFWELINFFATNSLCFLLPVTLAETLFVISGVTIYIYIYIYNIYIIYIYVYIYIYIYIFIYLYIYMYVYLTVALEILYFRNTIFFTCLCIALPSTIAPFWFMFSTPPLGPCCFHISPYGLVLYV